MGCNPQDVLPLADDKIIVNYWGDYASLPAGTAIVDVNTLAVTQTGLALNRMSVYNGVAYGYVSTYGNPTVDYKTVSANGTVADLPFSLSISGKPYGITLNPANGDIYLFSDGNYTANGTVFCFTHSGDLRFMLEASMLPKKAVFL